MKHDAYLTRLFFAVPEMLFDEAVTSYLTKNGFITKEGREYLDSVTKDKRRVERVLRKTKGQSVFTRLLSVAPELVTINTVNLLRRFNYLDETQGHILRMAIRGIGAVSGTELTTKDVIRRAGKIFDITISEEMIGLLRSIDMVTVEEANSLRIALASGDAVATFGARALRAKKLADWLLLAGSTLVDQNALRAMKLSGVINVRTANALIEAAKYGKAQWTVWEGSKRADGLAARMAYMISGSFSWEAVDFLQSLGIMNPKYRYLLKVAVALSQKVNRTMMENMTQRRFRIQPGEAPIRTFAKSTRRETSDILHLLADAARESRDDAAAMKGLQASQRAIRAASLHRSMRELWEGVGHLTIFGERETAEAATEAFLNMNRAFTRHLPDDVRRMMNIQAKAGIDAYVSRQENRIMLSRRVYGNMDLMTGKIDKRINIHLLKGSSAEEIARDIARFISPNTPGGVSYAAMRLGRTELANAFHTTTIRRGREMPWVKGWQWHLSSSHGRPDKCNEYASDDHDGLGAGIFKKANIPGKPHPQCLCYITTVSVSEDEFVSNMRRGYYNRYMTQMMNNQDVTITVGERVRQRAMAGMASYVLPMAATGFVNAG